MSIEHWIQNHVYCNGFFYNLRKPFLCSTVKMGHQRPYKSFLFCFLLRLGSNFLPPTDAVLKKKTMEKGGGRGEQGRERGRGRMGERFKGTFSEACFFLALLGWKYIRLHAAVYKEAENGKNLQQEHTINSMLCSRTTTSLFWRNPIHNICVCMYGSHQQRGTGIDL